MRAIEVSRKNWGNKLKEIRLIHGMTKTSIAALCGVSLMSVSHWENGLSVPNEEAFRKLSSVLKGIEDPAEIRVRFSLGPNCKSEMIALKINVETSKWCNKEAKKRGVPVSKVIRDCIAMAMKLQAEGRVI